MTRFAYLTPTLAVAGSLSPADFAFAAAEGFRTIVNNRPDGEEPAQLTAREEAMLAARAGLAYLHVPAAKHMVLEPEFVREFEAVLRKAEGPVLLHCRSGLRSTITWAAIAVGQGVAVEDVLAAARAAGQTLDGVRDEIAEFSVPREQIDAGLARQVAA